MAFSYGRDKMTDETPVAPKCNLPKKDRTGLITQYAITDQLRTVYGTQAAFPSQRKSILDAEKFLTLSDTPTDMECLFRTSYSVASTDDLLLLRRVGFDYKLTGLS